MHGAAVFKPNALNLRPWHVCFYHFRNSPGHGSTEHSSWSVDGDSRCTRENHTGSSLTACPPRVGHGWKAASGGSWVAVQPQKIRSRFPLKPGSITLPINVIIIIRVAYESATLGIFLFLHVVTPGFVARQATQHRLQATQHRYWIRRPK